MESQRRTQLSTTPTPTPAVIRPGVNAEAGLFARYGNTVLTVILLVAAGVLAYRWYTRSADAARQAVVLQLETARQNVDQLRSPQLLYGSNGLPLASADVVAKIRMLQTTASGALSDVINKADAPAIKARALVVRGDLAWAVANLPELPGAATQPALRLDPPSDVLLGQAADAYSAVLGIDGADKESLAAAHLGLAAVAENKGDWDNAKTQLQSVAGDANGVAVLSAAAKAQLAELPTLAKPIYVAPPTGIDIPATPAATQPTTGPATPGMMGPVPSMPLPTSRPTSVPVRVPSTKPATVPTSMPGTMPVK